MLSCSDWTRTHIPQSSASTISKISDIQGQILKMYYFTLLCFEIIDYAIMESQYVIPLDNSMALDR